MAQQGVVFTPLPSFPWVPGDKLDAVPLNNEFFALHNLVDNLQRQINELTNSVNQNNLGFSLLTNFGGNSTPTEGPYELFSTAPYSFNIMHVEASIGTSDGSFQFSILVNGVPVDGLTDLVVQNLRDEFDLATPILVHQGSEVVMVISSIDKVPLNSWVSLNGNTNILPPPVLGTGIGFAEGVSNAFARGVSTDAPGLGIFMANGRSTAFAPAMSADRGVGFAFGASAAHGVIVQVMLGASTGSVMCVSLAQGVGTFSTAPNVLVLDDPADGKLNINPLG